MRQSRRGGTTLTIAVLEGSQLTVGVVGDSPAYAVHGSRVVPVTPRMSGGALRHWLGKDANADVWVGTCELPPHTCVLVCTDGVNPRDGLTDAVADPSAWVRAALEQARNDDDATVVAAMALPLAINAGRPKRGSTQSARSHPAGNRATPVDITVSEAFTQERPSPAGAPSAPAEDNEYVTRASTTGSYAWTRN
jgi:hypothetical protein